MKKFGDCRAVIFDMDGTLYEGDALIPGAPGAVKAIAGAGKRVCYFTNNSSRCGGDYALRLSEMGFPAQPEDILTSGDVAKDYLLRAYPGRRALVFGTRALRACFAQSVPLDDAEPEVAVLGFHTEMTYPELAALCGALRRGIPYLATHPDKNCPSRPFPIPDAGSFAALIEASTGRRPDAVCGKPTRMAGEYLVRTLGVPPDEIAFVGDRYSTDILLGKNNGFFTVQVETGAGEDTAGLEPADLVIPSVASLPQFL